MFPRVRGRFRGIADVLDPGLSFGAIALATPGVVHQALKEAPTSLPWVALVVFALVTGMILTNQSPGDPK